MGRFCGIDPSLIDDILEAADEKAEKKIIQTKTDEESDQTKETHLKVPSTITQKGVPKGPDGMVCVTAKAGFRVLTF